MKNIISKTTSIRSLKKKLKKYAPEMEGSKFKRVVSHAKAGRIIQLLPNCWLGKGWVAVYKRCSPTWTPEVDFFRLTAEELTPSQAALIFGM